MARFFLTYDLKEDHTRVKTALIEKGWKMIIQGDNPCHLPNTSLWTESSLNTETVRDAAVGVIRAKSTSTTNLERIIVVRFDNWAGLVGAPF
jgi:hypothetical protein